MRDSRRDTDIKNRLLDSVGEGEGGMIWKNDIETCKLSCVKWIANPGSVSFSDLMALPRISNVFKCK